MGRAPCCDKANVKKGPWSPEEDATLKAYIEKNGTGGNWITLPQKIGLKRCGKSCRLRWLNYLRPNIRHGSFSEEEDSIICSLYTNIGSRWSIIAAQLPGRTDNDIKNYWNTRLKKRLLGPSPPSSSRARRIAMATEVPSQSSTPFAGTDSSGNGLNTSNRHDTVRPNGVAAAVTLDDGFLQVNQQALIWSANYTTCPQIQDFASQTPSPSLLPVLTAEPNLNTEGEEQAAIRRILMILDGRIGSNCTLPIYTAPIDIADGDRVTAPTFDGAFAFDAASSPSSSNANAVASYSSLLASMMQQQQQQQIECSIPCYPVQIDVTTEGEFDGLCGAMSSILDDGASASTTSSSESNGGACWNAVSDPLLTYPPLSDLLRAECAMHQQPQRSSMNQYQLVHPATETR